MFFNRRNKVHVYLVCWDTLDRQKQSSSGYTEITLDRKMAPGDIKGMMEFVHSLMDQNEFDVPTPKSVTYLGEVKNQDA